MAIVWGVPNFRIFTVYYINYRNSCKQSVLTQVETLRSAASELDQHCFHMSHKRVSSRKICQKTLQNTWLLWHFTNVQEICKSCRFDMNWHWCYNDKNVSICFVSPSRLASRVLHFNSKPLDGKKSTAHQWTPHAGTSQFACNVSQGKISMTFDLRRFSSNSGIFRLCNYCWLFQGGFSVAFFCRLSIIMLRLLVCVVW